MLESIHTTVRDLDCLVELDEGRLEGGQSDEELESVDKSFATLCDALPTTRHTYELTLSAQIEHLKHWQLYTSYVLYRLDKKERSEGEKMTLGGV